MARRHATSRLAALGTACLLTLAGGSCKEKAERPPTPTASPSGAPVGADAEPRPGEPPAGAPGETEEAQEPAAQANPGAEPAPEGEPEPEPGLGLEARLIAEVGEGQTVAILPWHRGLMAVSADGARQRLLAAGPVKFALVDHRARVIWFAKASDEGEGGAEEPLPPHDELWLLDLAAPTSAAAPTPRPTRIATGLPFDFDFHVRYQGAGPNADEEISLAAIFLQAGALLTLDVSGTAPRSSRSSPCGRATPTSSNGSRPSSRPMSA